MLRRRRFLVTGGATAGGLLAGGGTLALVNRGVLPGQQRLAELRGACGDAPAMIVDELLPRLATIGLRVDRLALWGWSLGGFGVLHLATLLPPERIGAVVATSPALWRRFDAARPGTFGGEKDFTRADVFTRTEQLATLPLRVDCGEADAFAGAARSFRSRYAPEPAGTLGPGCHDAAYWTRIAGDQLDFIGNHLVARH